MLFHQEQPQDQSPIEDMYYRAGMIDCKQPSEELKHVQHVTGNYFKL